MIEKVKREMRRYIYIKVIDDDIVVIISGYFCSFSVKLISAQCLRISKLLLTETCPLSTEVIS